MIFNFGGSKSSSSSSSESQSSSFDNVDQTGFSFNREGSVSGGSSRSTSRVAFEDLFRQLFGGASNAAAGIDTGAIGGAAEMLFNAGGGFLDELQGGAGEDYLTRRLTESDELVDQQIGFLGDDISKFVGEKLNPGITSGGVSAGTLGNSRGEIQRGMVSDAALNQFMRGATDIRMRSQEQLDNAAVNLMSGRTNRAQTASQFLPMMMNMAQTGAMASMAPYQALAQIMGGPTVLSDSVSSQFGSSFGEGMSFEEMIGRAASQSTSESKSQSSSMSMSMGFSDRRLKRNIKRIGTVMGHAWYLFEYIWGELAVGVMADEVPPEYVTIHPSGYAMVNYRELLNG